MLPKQPDLRALGTIYLDMLLVGMATLLSPLGLFRVAG
jgi:hypothetical protein